VRVAGVDGTKGGWVAIVLEEGRFVADLLLPSVESDFAGLGDVDVIGIDVPIGFGPREADKRARAYLKGAASTVFSAPSRDVLVRPFGRGMGVPAQAHALGPRILHVTELAQFDNRFREVHPEVSFRAMNGGDALRYRKKSAGGALERTELLRRHCIELFEIGPSATAPLDDVLDAAAAAWSAQRVAVGSARSLPDPPELVDGYPVAIWY